ncbi:MAG TPA: enoyl-CoA hydratase/isomerase family protein, partial [Burkholderiaceae bacterium]|nr:enoyl-CoA hydratase/isomerase family protein [Burkholderiaceae bacterium]
FAACDVRWLVPGASLRFPGAGFGLVLGTRRLAARVGQARALRWVSEATTLDDRQAVAAGLADEILAPDPVAASGSGHLAGLAAGLPPVGVDRETMSALRAAARDRDADRDLAALVRSAARPGLKARIAAYRATQLAARGGG